MSNWPFYVAIGICVVEFTVIVTTYAALLPKDSAQNTKLLALVSVFSFVAAITAYMLAQYALSTDYMIQFLLATVFLIAIPSSLISVAISTIAVSNMRDTLAAGP